MHAFFGLYLWELVVTLDFDWDYLSGKRRFKWPLIFYFCNRYFMLVALVGVITLLNVTRSVYRRTGINHRCIILH